MKIKDFMLFAIESDFYETQLWSITPFTSSQKCEV